MKKEIKGKKRKVKMWELPKISLDVNDDGDVVLISCKICKISYDKKQILDLSIVDWLN